jgi:hypothetical protein
MRTDALRVAEEHFTRDEIGHVHMPITRLAVPCGANDGGARADEGGARADEG